MTTKINTIDFPSETDQELTDLYITALGNYWNVEDLIEELHLKFYLSGIDQKYINRFIHTGFNFKVASDELKKHCKKHLLKRGFSEDEIRNLIHRHRDE